MEGKKLRHQDSFAKVLDCEIWLKFMQDRCFLKDQCLRSLMTDTSEMDT